jgi:hypothetical protein
VARTTPRRTKAKVLSPLEGQVRAWWVSVLATGRGVDHPVFGARIRAKVKDDVIVVSGVVENPEERGQLFWEAEALEGAGVRGVRVEVAIDGERETERLLCQTLLTFFAGRLQAEFAQALLEPHPDINLLLSEIMEAPDEPDDSRLLHPRWHEEARLRLAKGQVVLATQVDETHAFRARELLAEETRSLLTVVLPPEVWPEAAPAMQAEKPHRTSARPRTR